MNLRRLPGLLLAMAAVGVLFTALQSLLSPPPFNPVEIVTSARQNLSAPRLNAAASIDLTPAQAQVTPVGEPATESNDPIYLPLVQQGHDTSQQQEPATAGNAFNNNADDSTTALVHAATVIETLIYVSLLYDGNIHALDPTNGSNFLYFDASDVGLGVRNTNAFHIEEDGSLLLSFDRTVFIPNIPGLVDQGDIVRFVPVTLGEETVGTFELFLDGSDVNLTGIFGLSRAPDGRLVVSTAGDSLHVFNATTWGEATTGSFATFFDLDAVGMADNFGEETYGLWIDGPAGAIYLTTRGEYTTGDGLSGDQNDVLRCTLGAQGTAGGCTFTRFWDGNSYNITGRLDALHISRPRPTPGTLSGQIFLDNGYDGQRDPGDSPWANLLVTLHTLFGATDSTTTDASGLYSFPAYPGRYSVRVAGQPGYAFAPQDIGDDATDSDVGADGRSATVVLSSTQTIVIDAGLGIPPTPTPTPPQSPLPTPPPFSPLPTPTNTPEGYTLPDRALVDQCFFTPPPGGIPNEPFIPLSAYSFSAPQEVITHTAPIGIHQWLPDNETLLITRESMENQLVSVDLVNTTTGAVTQIVEPLQYLTEPRWLSLNDTVAWRAIGTLDDMDPGVWEPGYWVRSFDPPWERQLADRGSGASTSHDVSPDGKQLVFMSLPAGTQPLIWNQEIQTLDDLPIDLVQRRYQKGLSYPLRPFYPLWHPSGDKILFHDGTWMTLYDLTTNSGCDIDLRTFDRRDYYIRDAQWSPDGRYLLIKNGSAPLYTTLEGPFDQLLVLDMYTGETTQHTLANTIYSFSWAPNSQIVAVEEKSEQLVDGFATSILYLLNVRTGEHLPISSEGALLGISGKRILWSSSGDTIAYHCQTAIGNSSSPFVDRVCISQIMLNQ